MIFVFKSELSYNMMIHFELKFVYGERRRCPVFLEPFIEETLGSPVYVLTTCVEN
jgi:hypothetical protein